MDATPNWMQRECYNTHTLKAELISMSLSLHYAWTTTKAELRTTEMALIEARTTLTAYARKIDEDADTMRRLVAKANRIARAETGEFTMAQLRDASERYCELHGCKSVDLEVLKDALRKGHV